MRIVVGADHAGYDLKETLKKYMISLGHDVVDVGAHDRQPSDDYPDFARLVGERILAEPGIRGVLVCGSGVGASVAANKMPGIRAAVCHDCYSAAQGVQHDDMNVLTLGSRIIGIELAKDLVGAFLSARFSGEERHKRRLSKVRAIEAEFSRPT